MISLMRLMSSLNLRTEILNIPISASVHLPLNNTTRRLSPLYKLMKPQDHHILLKGYLQLSLYFRPPLGT